ENRAGDPAYVEVFTHLKTRLKEERHHSVPERNHPWPYLSSRASTVAKLQPPPPARLVRRLVQRLGMHPDSIEHFTGDLKGHRALVVGTNHGDLDGKPTGVFASELTVPYYAFLDAGMQVDVA